MTMMKMKTTTIKRKKKRKKTKMTMMILMSGKMFQTNPKKNLKKNLTQILFCRNSKSSGKKTITRRVSRRTRTTVTQMAMLNSRSKKIRRCPRRTTRRHLQRTSLSNNQR